MRNRAPSRYGRAFGEAARGLERSKERMTMLWPPHAAFRLRPIAEIGDAEAVALDQAAQFLLAHRGGAREVHVERKIALRWHARFDQCGTATARRA